MYRDSDPPFSNAVTMLLIMEKTGLTGMRPWMLMLIVMLVAGCAGPNTDTAPTPDVEDTQDVDVPDGDAGPLDEVVAWNATAFDGSIDLAASGSVPAPASSTIPWFMAIGAEVDAIETEDLSEVLIEILYTADTGGGGAAWLTDPGEPTAPASPVASVQADEGTPGSVRVSAEDFMAMEDPSFYVSGGGSSYYAVGGKIHLVVTAFYGMPAPDGFSAL